MLLFHLMGNMSGLLRIYHVGPLIYFPRSVTSWYRRAIKASNQRIWPLELSGLFITYQPIASWQLSHLAFGYRLPQPPKMPAQRCGSWTVWWPRGWVWSELKPPEKERDRPTSHGAVYQQHCCIPRKESIGWEGHFPQEEVRKRKCLRSV